MNKAYNPIDWKNEPNTSTPINETNLNKMDRAIDTIDNRVIGLDNGKVNKEDGKSLVPDTDITKIGANETAIQSHISNKSNPHSVTKSQVGLGNVDNTSDADKPISTAQQAKIDAINNNLSVIGKCKNLLNPTLQTTTVNGVTCTANGDGTFTLNGTATEEADFTIFDNLKKHQHLKNRTVKLVGCPKGGSLTTYRILLQLQQSPWKSAVDSGGGSSVTVDNNDNWMCWIRIYKDATLSNLTFKPMITENLNATYDDFVQYTGDGETLTHDVAELKNDLSEKLKVISVSLEGVTVSGNSSATVSLPQEYIDAGYVIANILAVPDTRLSYITSSATNFDIRNSSNSAVMFVPTATVSVLIAKIG